MTEHVAGEEFLELAGRLLEALAGADGFIDGSVARSPDEPDMWLMTTNWRDVGSMRRGFGSFDAKVAAAPVMLTAADRASAFEVLLHASPTGLVAHETDRAPDAAG